VEQQLTDRVIVIRDPGVLDDVWNEATGQYEPDELDPAETVYDGAALIVSRGWTPQEILEGQQETTMSMYKLDIPLEAPEVLEDDSVLCTVCMRDPRLVNQLFIVRDQILSSFAVVQGVSIEKHTGRRPR